MIYVGTSGFNYAYWKNRFYPEKLPASRWLEYYATQFNTLELNNTFYRFPKLEHLKKWAQQTPADFQFTVKANKIITHNKRMKDVKDKIAEFIDLVTEGLENKLACILYQLPPSYNYSEERLNNVLENLSGDSRSVVEFRHISWWDQKVYETLEESNLSFCSVSYPGLPADNIMTGNTFYKRMHGVPELFRSSYSNKELKELSKDLPVEGDTFVYFNNTTYEAGYSNAAYLKELFET